MKDRLDLPSLEARDQPAGLFCWDSDKVNVSERRLRNHLGHDRQRAVGPGADDQPGSAPRELLVGRERSVSELVAVWLRGLLAPFAHGTSVNDDVVLVRSSVDLDRPEPEESHIHHVPPHPSVRKSNTSESTLIVSARKPVRPTAVGPLGDDLVLVAKGRFQAFVDDARLFGRDWGRRLTDVKASVLADQRCDAFPRGAWHRLDRCNSKRGRHFLTRVARVREPKHVGKGVVAICRRAGTMFVKYGRDNVTRARPIHTRDCST